jgi:methylthioribose-1-phosphate isomerase
MDATRLADPAQVRQLAADAAVANPAFDITPASLVSTLISERGACPASQRRAERPLPGGTVMPFRYIHTSRHSHIVSH